MLPIINKTYTMADIASDSDQHPTLALRECAQALAKGGLLLKAEVVASMMGYRRFLRSMGFIRVLSVSKVVLDD